MSFVGRLADGAVTRRRAPRCAPHRAAERGQRRKPVIGDERRSAARTRFVDVRDAAADRDEEIAGPARRESISTPVTLPRRRPAGRARATAALLGERDQVPAPRERSASRAASRSSNGIVRSASCCPAPRPCRRSDHVTVACKLDRAHDRRGAVRLDLDVGDDAGDDSPR